MAADREADANRFLGPITDGLPFPILSTRMLDTGGRMHRLEIV